MMKNPLVAIHDFLHARTGEKGIRQAGMMRIAYAILYLYDQAVLGWSLEMFVLPSSGIIPYNLAMQSSASYLNTEHTWTLLQLFPESDAFVWLVWLAGLVHGVLLLLGVAPRLQLVGIMVNLMTFHHQNGFLWDCEDEMIRLWCFFLMILPVHMSITIYDKFGFAENAAVGEEKNNRSWPMWPFRLWQLEICLIYCCCIFTKLNGVVWIGGDAMYHVSHETNYYGGIFNPEFLFNRMPMLRFMTYAAIWIEGTSWITIWFKPLRWFTLLEVWALHIGIEVSMSLHVFQWLSILGWSVFLVEPEKSNQEWSKEDIQKMKKKEPSKLRRFAGTCFFFTFLLCFASDANPMYHIVSICASFNSNLVPSRSQRILGSVRRRLHAVNRKVSPYMHMVGLEQGSWDMFGFDGPEIDLERDAWFSVNVTLDNDTVLEWRTPVWTEMHPLEKKKYIRYANFICSVDDNNGNLARASMAVWAAKYLTRDDELSFGTIRSITVYRWWENSNWPREGLGWFEPAREKMARYHSVNMELTPCRDRHTDCAKWASTGQCDASQGMCPKSCPTSVRNEYKGFIWEEKSDDDYNVDDGGDDDDDDDVGNYHDSGDGDSDGDKEELYNGGDDDDDDDDDGNSFGGKEEL